MIEETTFAGLVETMERIERHLATIASYASFLHVQATGEKTFQVQRFVVGRDSEDNPCIWLYGTHPGLEFAVTRIYHETLPALPLTVPNDAKLWDGEQAPSTDKAARGGYFCLAPAPFTISLMPTGKKTDSGMDIRRFSRVVSIDAPTPPQTNGAPVPPPPPAPSAPRPSSDADFDRLPGHERSAYVPAEPAPAPSPQPAAASKPAFMTTERPWPSTVAAEAIRYTADAKQRKGEGIEETDGRFGAVIGIMDSLPFDTDCRREFLKEVFGVESAKELSGAQRMALAVWAKPAKVDGAWTIAKPAVIEYRRIIGWTDEDDEIPF